MQYPVPQHLTEIVFVQMLPPTSGYEVAYLPFDAVATIAQHSTDSTGIMVVVQTSSATYSR